MMGSHRKMCIYVRYHSPSILKYMEPMAQDLFKTWYANCIFNDDYFPTLEENFRTIHNVRK
jgi:uncharacterized protein YozE (UPF0346 family)